jgi:hypothetical protein
MFDSGDAAGANRYGMPGPETYKKFMDKLEGTYPGGPSSLGTQFDNNLFKLARGGGLQKLLRKHCK